MSRRKETRRRDGGARADIQRALLSIDRLDLDALEQLEEPLASESSVAGGLPLAQRQALRALLVFARRARLEIESLRVLEDREREAAAADEAAGRGDAGLRAYARGMGRRRGGRGRGPGTDWWDVAWAFVRIPQTVPAASALERVARPRNVSPKTARARLWAVSRAARDRLAELEAIHAACAKQEPGLGPSVELRELRELVAGLRRLPRSLPPQGAASRKPLAEYPRKGDATRRRVSARVDDQDREGEGESPCDSG